MLTPQREGWFASDNPRATTAAGGAALVAASPDGCAIGRFAWLDAAAYTVSNERGAQTQILGFVLAQRGDWRSIYLSDGARWIRPGLPVTLMSKGEFWCKFADGAEPGARVWASILDGAAYAGETDDAQETVYRVVTQALPGGLAIISSWSFR